MQYGYTTSGELSWFTYRLQEHDLMRFPVRDDAYGGALAEIVRKARQALAPLNGYEVLKILDYPDIVAEEWIERGEKILCVDGSIYEMNEDAPNRLSQLHFCLWILDLLPVTLGAAVGREPDIELTPEMLLAALTLSEAFQAVEVGYNPDWIVYGGAYHAMQAAAAWATFEVFAQAGHPVRAILADAERSAQAKRAAAGRLANDPKQRAKAEAYGMWQKWDRAEFRTQAALAAHIVDATGLTSVKHVESLITRWERTQRAR